MTLAKNRKGGDPPAQGRDGGPKQENQNELGLHRSAKRERGGESARPGPAGGKRKRRRKGAKPFHPTRGENRHWEEKSVDLRLLERAIRKKTKPV